MKVLKGREAWNQLVQEKYILCQGKGKYVFESGIKVSAALIKHWDKNGMIQHCVAGGYKLRVS